MVPGVDGPHTIFSQRTTASHARAMTMRRRSARWVSGWGPCGSDIKNLEQLRHGITESKVVGDTQKLKKIFTIK